MAPSLETWHDFNVAMLGATAALAGLVIVAASVNIAVIVKTPSMTARLAAAISSLVVAITVCGVCLMPDVAMTTLGIVAIACAAIAGAFQVHALQSMRAARSSEPAHVGVRSGPGFVPPIAYAVGGLLAITTGENGLYAFGAACILTIVSALFMSWVVLVEVLR